MTEGVLGPWTPIGTRRTDGVLSLSPWGRRYDFGAFPFPAQIESVGEALLSSPARLSVQVEGEAVDWETSPLQVEEEKPGEVVFSQRTQSASMVLTASTRVEYDGLIRIDWKIESRRPVVVRDLAFEIPLRKERARHYYYCPPREELTGGDGGLLPREGFRARFGPYVWIGDEERGLAWFSESDRNWHGVGGETSSGSDTTDPADNYAAYLVSGARK